MPQSKFIGTVIAIGLFDAGLLGAVCISLASSWAFGEVFGWAHSLNQKIKEAPWFYAYYFFDLLLAGTVVLIPNAPLVLITLFVQVIATTLLPAALVFLILLLNDKKTMGGYVNTTWENIANIGIVIGIIVTSTLYGLSAVFENLPEPDGGVERHLRLLHEPPLDARQRDFCSVATAVAAIMAGIWWSGRSLSIVGLGRWLLYRVSGIGRQQNWLGAIRHDGGVGPASNQNRVPRPVFPSPAGVGRDIAGFQRLGWTPANATLLARGGACSRLPPRRLGRDWARSPGSRHGGLPGPLRPSHQGPGPRSQPPLRQAGNRDHAVR